MESKDALNSIADKYAIKEYDKDGNLIKWVGTIDKEYLTIMKDLEILEILKKCEDEKHSLYCVYVLNALSSGKITQDDVINVKEWLDA